MKRKAIIPLVLGLAIGLLAVKFGVDAIRRAQASGQAQKTITVVQARIDINAYDEIRPDMVEATETVENSLVPANDRVSDLNQALKRVTAKFIPKGSPVLLSMLAPEGTAPGLSGRIPTGFRACSVKIDESTAVSYQIKPGDWVDVTVVMDVETGRKGKKETIAEVILQHVQVAAVGYESTPENEKSLTKVKPAKSATLLVKEEDVPKLHLATTRGKITLAMRGDKDTEVSGNSAIAYEGDIGPRVTDPAPPQLQPDLLKQLAMGLATRNFEPEPEPHPVMVFHGSAGGRQATAMEQITFESAKSAKIVEMSVGGPSRAASTIRGARPQAGQPVAVPMPTPIQTPEGFPFQPDGDLNIEDEEYND
jgi:pilus assembly protein CpaB